MGADVEGAAGRQDRRHPGQQAGGLLAGVAEVRGVAVVERCAAPREEEEERQADDAADDAGEVADRLLVAERQHGPVGRDDVDGGGRPGGQEQQQPSVGEQIA